MTPRSDISDLSSVTRYPSSQLQHSASIDSIGTFNNSPVVSTRYVAVPTSEDSSTSTQPTIPQFVIRYFLVISTGLLATLIPNVGLLVSLAGASSGATLALILPPLIDLYINKNIPSIRYGINCASVALGIVGAIAGTYMSVVDIVKHVFMAW